MADRETPDAEYQILLDERIPTWIRDAARVELDRLKAKVEELERGRDEARSLVTEANNSLFGSQGKG